VMKTVMWFRTATIEGAVWNVCLDNGRLDLWGGGGGGRHIRTVYIDGREALWASDPWPEEIVAAWQEMLDVMKREAGQE
jgi:hypothetical protein